MRVILNVVFVLLWAWPLAFVQGSSRGMVRYQRGDQGPDDLDNDISIIDFEQNKTISVRPPIGGPNVCRSRSRTFCCPGWHQRGSTGLCLVPICSSNRCGPTGRCIKPGLCLCDGGTIATNCGNSNAIGSNGCNVQCLNGGSCRNETCSCRPGYAGDHCQEPVCKNSCENGGRCIGPNRCACVYGYTGRHCEIDYRTGPCFRRAGPGTCSGQLEGVVCTKQLCCATIGKAWGHPCEKCPQNLSCQLGFIRNVHTGRCMDINECEAIPGLCIGGECQNDIGSFECICPEGKTVDENHVCQDEDECSAYNQGQEICPNGRCINRDPGYICICNPGYIPAQDQKSCLDARQGFCYRSEDSQCQTPRAFKMSRMDCCCKHGSSWSESRNACDACPPIGSNERELLCKSMIIGPNNITDVCFLKPNICPNGKCVPDNSVSQGYVCQCDQGYEMRNGQCTDINECQQGLCANGICRNNDGSFECQCPTGFHLSADRKQCTDYNECQQTGMCANGICSNMNGSFKCDCNEGYKLVTSGLSCVDVNECQENPMICLHGRCQNTLGSYVCECDQGYIHSGDGGFCLDHNECDDDVCGQHGRCINMDGNYRCMCDPGYSYNGKTCVDIDECQSNPCLSGTCINSEGNFKCECPEGFSLGPDGRTCTDTIQGSCYAMYRQGQCVNPSGKMVSKSSCCCGTSQFGLPKGWGFPCQVCPMTGSYEFDQLCPHGSGFTNSGEDINECATNPKICGDHGACENIQGSYRCKCEPGYQPDPTGKTCEDINECSDPFNCRKGQCRNTQGSFQCVCPTGMEFSEDTRGCEDVDECSDQLSSNNNNSSMKCPNGKCINTDGGYQCECKEGTSLDSSGSICIDSRRGTCWRDVNANTQQCENSLLGLTLKSECCCSAIGVAWGSPCEKCDPSTDCNECPSGMAMLDGKTCQDIDECALDPTLCSGGVCVNTEGSYTCRCPSGLTQAVSQTGTTSCVDERVEPCYMEYRLGSCSDDIGGLYKKDKCCCTIGRAWGFGCSHCPKPGTPAFDELCPKGYGFIDNVDVNECLAFPDMCQNGRCKNTLGDYNCRCNQGYAIDKHGITCSNIDECAIMKGVCGNGTCIDVPGSFTCDCDPGFAITPLMQVCMDINECEQSPGLCRGGKCINTPGLFHCECPQGLELTEDGKNCKDIDECSQTSGICSNGVCENMMGAYQCICDEGYKQAGSGTSCVDVDECAEANGGCDDLCINSPGSFSCACNSGFMLLLDGKQCKDIDECAESRNPCNGGKCINTPGGYSCICSGGLMMGPDATSCLDLDECAVNEDVCRNGKCENILGSFQCHCEDGFSVKLKVEDGCTDDDECSLNIHHCDPMATCKNTNGSYDCICNEGFSGDGYDCKDINECLKNNGGCSTNARCINTIGGHRCICDNGFSGNGQNCTDIDECTDDPTLCEHGICLNDQGSFNCECQYGYMHPESSNSQSCMDIDECERIENICMNGLCENTNGIFRCICDQGYTLDENGSNCTDINECDDPQSCQYGTCINSDGDFICECPDGFDKLPSGNGCIDNRKGSCYTNMTIVYNGSPICQNTMGQSVLRSACCCSNTGKAWGPDSCKECPSPGTPEYKIVCPGGPGYQPNPNTGILEDINECNTMMNICANGRCSNTFGSYMCTCNNGFKLDDNAVGCVDIDECLADPFVCGVGQCVNTPGGFECVCPQGYMLASDGRGCIDMRKESCYMSFAEGACDQPMTRPQTRVVCCCSMGKAWGDDCGICPEKGTQAYKQLCGNKPGMILDPLTGNPHEIDECQLMPGMCQNGVCVNTIGSFHCTCYPGYVYDETSHQCIDENECTQSLGGNPCQGIAKCINTPGSFECTCPAGYKLDRTGRKCNDINECQELISACQHGTCVNMEGSFQCTCNEGFSLTDSRETCVDTNECLSPGICGNGTCINTFGSFRCRCDYGFQLGNANTCEDIDECKVRFDICRNGRCKNVKGGFTCECTEGYKLSFDGMNCEDIDECQGNTTCPPPGICENSYGSFICTCPDGYQLDSSSTKCVDINECLSKPNFCSNGQCRNTQGGATCQCEKGWKLSRDGSKCVDNRMEPCFNDVICARPRTRNMTKQTCCCSLAQAWGLNCESCPRQGTQDFNDLCPLGPGRGGNGEDFNECLMLGPNICDGGICINTDGSYRCECPKGYKLDRSGKKCVDDNECLSMSNICGNGTCSNLNGSFECNCAEGYAPGPRGNCEDVDECTEYGHQCAFRCHNTPGSFRCVCPFGYEVAADGRHCIDINECDSQANTCRYACKNLIGSFMCVCPEGFRKLDVGDECEDINECAINPDICGAGGRCTNSRGGYICQCTGGYQSSPDEKVCLDRRQGFCYNQLLGGGKCRQTGASGLSSQQQVKVTKAECCCALGAAWGSAEQSGSSFGMSNKCEICPARGSQDFDQLCLESGFGPEGQDIDECKTLPGLCENGQCVNTLGSYRCICDRGFKPDPASSNTKCLDVDECRQIPGPCEHQCANTWGGFTCSCPQGYVLNSDGKTCRDVDECTTGVHLCQYECLNTLGSYECACPRGFRQMGDRCVDVDECVEQQGLCPRPGTCKNTHGSFKCVCPRGYRLDESGTFCIDRNECEEDGDKCDGSDCRNSLGSYKCGCPDGFVMNSVYQECVDANECLETENDKTCGNAQCQNSFGSFSCLCPSGYSYNNNLKVCVQSSSGGGCGEARCAFGCNSVGSSGFDCQCPRGHQAVMGPRGQVSHCIALNSVDNFLQEDNEKEFISTEGCYSCKINGGVGGSRSSRRSSRTVQRSRVSRHYSSSSRRSHHYRYRKKRLKRHDDMNAKFSSLRPVPFALELQDVVYNNVTNAIAKHHHHNNPSRPFTKLSIRLDHEQTKHKRPILFIVPARAETLLNYSIHGKDKDLLHLKDDSNGITRVLHYKKGVKVPPKNNSHSIITHHVRIIGQHNTRHPRHQNHHHQVKELNMKVKIIIVK